MGILALLCLSGCGGDDDGGQASDGGASQTSAAPARSSYSPPADDGTGPCAYPNDSGSEAARAVVTPPTHPDVSGTVSATVDTSVGAFGFSLDATKAPCTVNSFVSLARQGYFDKTTCHRLTVGTGFEVLQCGDPTGSGYGGPGYTIPDEFTGAETYPAGTLAMANTGQPDSGGSQFFIVYGDTRLPPSYTVFGTVDQATIGDVEKVQADGVDDANGPGDGKPNTPVDISSVTIS